MSDGITRLDLTVLHSICHVGRGATSRVKSVEQAIRGHTGNLLPRRNLRLTDSLEATAPGGLGRCAR
jgi:hypothetical protein